MLYYADTIRIKNLKQAAVERLGPFALVIGCGEPRTECHEAEWWGCTASFGGGSVGPGVCLGPFESEDAALSAATGEMLRTGWYYTSRAASIEGLKMLRARYADYRTRGGRIGLNGEVNAPSRHKESKS